MDMSDSESDVDQRPAAQELFANLKGALPGLKALLEKCSSHWGYEDPVYRFYHHSFKVYGLQATTAEIVKALGALAPGRELSKTFMQIVREGTVRLVPVFVVETTPCHCARRTRMIPPSMSRSDHFRA